MNECCAIEISSGHCVRVRKTVFTGQEEDSYFGNTVKSIYKRNIINRTCTHSLLQSMCVATGMLCVGAAAYDVQNG